MKAVSAALFAVLMVSGAATQAQTPTLGSNVQGNQPLDVTSESFAYDGTRCVAVWTGNVEMINGTDRLRSPRVEAVYPQNTAAAAGGQHCGSEVTRIEAAGPVYYVTPTQSARGDHGTFTGSSDTIVLTGNVVLTEGQNVMTGARATFNTRTRDAQIESGPSAQSSGRVRAVIFPGAGQRPGAARPGAARTPTPAPARPGR